MKLTDILHRINERVYLARRVTALTGGHTGVDTADVVAQGSGYAVNDTLTISGGTGTAATLKVTAVLSGKIVSAIVTSPGSYTVAPSSPNTPTGGSGSTASFALTMIGTDLDGVPTTGYDIISPAFVAIDLSNVISIYRLRAGTDATNSPFIIRPADYNGSTNQKVWELTGTKVLDTARPPRALTYAASVALDFNGGELQTLALTGDVILTTSNLSAGKRMMVAITADGTPRNYTFPGGWTFVGAAAPATIAASKTALLRLESLTAADSGVIAQYAEQP